MANLNATGFSGSNKWFAMTNSSGSELGNEYIDNSSVPIIDKSVVSSEETFWFDSESIEAKINGQQFIPTDSSSNTSAKLKKDKSVVSSEETCEFDSQDVEIKMYGQKCNQTNSSSNLFAEFNGSGAYSNIVSGKMTEDEEADYINLFNLSTAIHQMDEEKALAAIDVLGKPEKKDFFSSALKDQYNFLIELASKNNMNQVLEALELYVDIKNFKPFVEIDSEIVPTDKAHHIFSTKKDRKLQKFVEDQAFNIYLSICSSDEGKAVEIIQELLEPKTIKIFYSALKNSYAYLKDSADAKGLKKVSEALAPCIRAANFQSYIFDDSYSSNTSDEHPQTIIPNEIEIKRTEWENHHLNALSKAISEGKESIAINALAQMANDPEMLKSLSAALRNEQSHLIKNAHEAKMSKVAQILESYTIDKCEELSASSDVNDNICLVPSIRRVTDNNASPSNVNNNTGVVASSRRRAEDNSILLNVNNNVGFVPSGRRVSGNNTSPSNADNNTGVVASTRRVADNGTSPSNVNINNGIVAISRRRVEDNSSIKSPISNEVAVKFNENIENFLKIESLDTNASAFLSFLRRQGPNKINKGDLKTLVLAYGFFVDDQIIIDEFNKSSVEYKKIAPEFLSMISKLSFPNGIDNLLLAENELAKANEIFKPSGMNIGMLKQKKLIQSKIQEFNETFENPLNSFSLDSQTMAEAITIRDASLVSIIEFSRHVRARLKKQIVPSGTILDVESTFQKTVRWIGFQIVKEMNSAKRFDIINHYLEVGAILLKKNNHGALQVAKALMNPAVKRLIAKSQLESSSYVALSELYEDFEGSKFAKCFKKFANEDSLFPITNAFWDDCQINYQNISWDKKSGMKSLHEISNRAFQLMNFRKHALNHHDLSNSVKYATHYMSNLDDISMETINELSSLCQNWEFDRKVNLNHEFPLWTASHFAGLIKEFADVSVLNQFFSKGIFSGAEFIMRYKENDALISDLPENVQKEILGYYISSVNTLNLL